MHVAAWLGVLARIPAKPWANFSGSEKTPHKFRAAAKFTTNAFARGLLLQQAQQAKRRRHEYPPANFLGHQWHRVWLSYYKRYQVALGEAHNEPDYLRFAASPSTWWSARCSTRCFPRQPVSFIRPSKALSLLLTVFKMRDLRPHQLPGLPWPLRPHRTSCTCLPSHIH